MIIFAFFVFSMWHDDCPCVDVQHEMCVETEEGLG